MDDIYKRLVDVWLGVAREELPGVVSGTRWGRRFLLLGIPAVLAILFVGKGFRGSSPLPLSLPPPPGGEESEGESSGPKVDLV